MTRKVASNRSPTLHTALIGDPVSMWEKLAWDVDQFQDIQRSDPDETQPLAFAAINVCIAAWSLEKWTLAAWTKRQRDAGQKADEKTFYNLVREHVPTQAICSTVANTAKHAFHREDESWEGGEVRIEWEEGDEDGPSTYVLKYTDHRNPYPIVAYGVFEAVREEWWKCLVVLKLTDRKRHSPEFFQNKLKRIFGGVQRALPPGANRLQSEGESSED